MTDLRARGQLWTDVRLTVVDLETTSLQDGSVRIVSIGTVTCRGGHITSRWGVKHVNPGVPIHPDSTGIHHITDSDVAGKPPFAAHVDEVLPLVTPAQGEVLVLAAHNISFDIPILRYELGRAGAALPDVPLLDTMGDIVRLAQVGPPNGSRGLEVLIDALGITNADPHDAASDAEATALLACKMLELLADAGHSNLEALLAQLGGARSTTVRFSKPGSGRRHLEPVLPEEHVAAHATLVLEASASAASLAAWLDGVSECATLRCPHLAQRIASAAMPRATLLPVLSDLLRVVAAKDDTAATATLLGAMAPLLPDLPPAPTGIRNVARRTAAAAFDDAFGPLLVGRCDKVVYCPDCRTGDPCPLDVWRLSLAPAAIGDDLTLKRARNFFETTGRAVGTGAYTTLRRSHQALADAALRLVFRYYLGANQHATAGRLALQAMEHGCRDPEIAEAAATTIARGGRKADLAAACQLAERISALRNGSTDFAWLSLETRHSDLAGRLRRLEPQYEVTADGTLRLKRRHHPAKPRRTRPPRFLRPPVVDDAPISVE